MNLTDKEQKLADILKAQATLQYDALLVSFYKDYKVQIGIPRPGVYYLDAVFTWNPFSDIDRSAPKEDLPRVPLTRVECFEYAAKIICGWEK